MINIKSIWENQKPTGEVIIRTRIDEMSHLQCFAATNYITGQHLYIMSVSKNVAIPELKNYRFKGVEIYTLPIESESKIELYIYLLDNELKDIFSLFIQNILEDIEQSITETEALAITLDVVSKWKKLFDKININGLSLEQQKGLLGELLFLNELLLNKKTYSRAINSWTSTEQDFTAKDFILGSHGFEIKFTTSKQPRIKISNERQLDIENFDSLYLILFVAEAVKEKGISLNSMVEAVRKNILTEEERSLFNSKLMLYGYLDDDNEHYNRLYLVNDTLSFLVNSEFPKIIKNNLPLGIFDTTYSIEVSAAQNYIIEYQQIFTKI